MQSTLQETWAQWEGEMIDGRFLLRRYLDGDQASAMFLADDARREIPSATIKLIPADSENAELKLSRWQLGAALSHPHLIRIYETGHTSLNGVSLYYAVMEHAQESLSEVLRDRPLSVSEAHEMIGPVVKALSYLHSKDLVHGHLNPANIVAVNDQLKITSHELFRAGEPHPRSEAPGSYDPPEISQGVMAPGDIWSLGVLLVEAVTQHPPVPEPGQEEPILPTTMTPQLVEIARHALKRDYRRRWSALEIARRLSDSSTEGVPTTSRRKGLLGNRRYAVMTAALGVALVCGVALGPGLLSRSDVSRTSSNESERTGLTPKPLGESPRRDPGQLASAGSGGRVLMPDVKSAGSTSGGVTHQVLPSAPARIQNGIRGTVRVRVGVQVDSAGKVVGARIDSTGGSKYFANLSLQAARQWKFRAPSVNGQDVSSGWTIAFAFTRSRTSAVPRRTAP